MTSLFTSLLLLNIIYIGHKTFFNFKLWLRFPHFYLLLDVLRPSPIPFTFLIIELSTKGEDNLLDCYEGSVKRNIVVIVWIITDLLNVDSILPWDRTGCISDRLAVIFWVKFSAVVHFKLYSKQRFLVHLWVYSIIDNTLKSSILFSYDLKIIGISGKGRKCQL